MTVAAESPASPVPIPAPSAAMINQIHSTPLHSSCNYDAYFCIFSPLTRTTFMISISIFCQTPSIT